jgi:dihydroorotate dehydrogenase
MNCLTFAPDSIMLYKKLLRPLFFLWSPEKAHHLAFGGMKFFLQIPGVRGIVTKFFHVDKPNLSRDVFGLHFQNPVGLAAGLDKNATLFDELAALGFGFVEIGTVTPLPQPGNPQPRLFRLPKDQALINRMGFNNDGVKVIAERLRKKKSRVIIGGNIGKNKITPNEKAINDYEICFRGLYDVVDYFVVNVSSPNTPGLRELQEKEPLLRILMRLQQVNNELAHEGNRKPVLLKIAPDLTESQLDEIMEVVQTSGIDGIVATNTTLSRDNLLTEKEQLASIGAGGLSGKPLNNKATEVIRYIHKKSQGTIPVIGVGGIHSPADAIAKLNAGASLIQVYTGFVYEGPGFVRDILQAIWRLPA